jgi:hypothetical protein
MSYVVSWVKASLPARHWRGIRRASNRLRWLLKLQLLRKYKFPILKRPWRALKYVLWDPEVESYTYQMGNESEYIRFIAPILGVPETQVEAWLDEAKADPYLTRDRGLLWSCKRRLPLGNRLMWYPIVRATKPKIIVEAGIHEGLGSEMLLVALRHNQAEGHAGRLISFDIHEDTGWLVHRDLRSNWQIVLEPTTTALEPRLADVEVDLFIHETPHTEDLIHHEVNHVLRRAGPRVAVIDSSGMDCPILQQLCARHDTAHHFFRDQPDDHVVHSHGMGLAFFDREKIEQSECATAAA